MDIWDEMYKAAKEKLNPRVISPFIDAGGVAAAISTITLNELIPDWWGKGQMNANCDL